MIYEKELPNFHVLHQKKKKKTEYDQFGTISQLDR